MLNKRSNINHKKVGIFKNKDFCVENINCSEEKRRQKCNAKLNNVVIYLRVGSYTQIQ